MPSEPPIDISVVMGSFNQAGALARVLAGYAAQDATCSFEVIIVDSFSTDTTAKMMAAYTTQRHPLRFIQRDNPAGKGEARNEGVRLAKGSIIIISDADMIPDPRFVQAHFDAHRASTEPTCFEGKAYNLQTYVWPISDTKGLATQIPAKYKPNAALNWYYFLTGNISFPKSLFDAEGGFCLDFKQYGWEDLELGYRLKKRGVPLRYLTTAINFHYHIISNNDRIKRKYAMGQSARIFIEHHPELRWFLGMHPLAIFVRRRLSKRHFLYRKMADWSQIKSHPLRNLGQWFLGEYNYVSGLLNLPITD